MEISVQFPDYLANSMRMNEAEFEKEVKLISLIKLYEMGQVSSGMAAKVLKIPRVEFLLLLGKYGVSIFGYSAEELESDIRNA